MRRLLWLFAGVVALTALGGCGSSAPSSWRALAHDLKPPESAKSADCVYAGFMGDQTYSCHYRRAGSNRRAIYDGLESYYQSNGLTGAVYRADRGGIVVVRDGTYGIVQVFIGPTDRGIGSKKPIAAGEAEIEILVRDAPG